MIGRRLSHGKQSSWASRLGHGPAARGALVTHCRRLESLLPQPGSGSSWDRPGRTCRRGRARCRVGRQFPTDSRPPVRPLSTTGVTTVAAGGFNTDSPVALSLSGGLNINSVIHRPVPAPSESLLVPSLTPVITNCMKVFCDHRTGYTSRKHLLS